MKAVAPVALLAAGTLALSAWLLLPRGAGAQKLAAPLRVALVDASASAARGEEWLPWVRAELRRQAETALAEQADLAVVSFADGVATVFAPGPPGDFLERLPGKAGPPIDPRLGLAAGATRLADALLALEPLLADPRRRGGTLALLAPLSYTGPSPAAAFARLEQAGVAFETRTPPTGSTSDLGLVELVVAPRLEAGAPLVALVRGTLRRGNAAPAGAVIELDIDGEGERVSLRRELTLPEHDGPFELTIDCGPARPGRSELHARCRLTGALDPVPENDEARATTRASGARVLGVACRDELREAAEAWLAPAGSSAFPGLQFVFLSSGDLGRELEGLDALVTFDLRPSELPRDAVLSFVRRGGGWLALSGWRFLGDWTGGEPQPELLRLLPCEPARAAPPPRRVVLVVDGSGSMAGDAFEGVRAAALELVSAALPSDRVGLCFFTTRLEPEHLLKERSPSRAGDAELLRAATRELLAVRVPSGATFLLRSLRELEPEQEAEPGVETLALLLTDGRERENLPDAVAQAREVRAELARRKVRLVVVAVGDADLELLAALAGGTEEVRRGESWTELRTLFERELFAGELAEGRIELTSVAGAPGSLVAEVAGSGPEVFTPPSLERYLRGRLRPGAEALWESASGAPVLALQRVGLGRTAFFASCPLPGWSGRSATPFAGLLRWLARGPERVPDLGARLADGWLTVSGFDARAPARVRARLVWSDVEPSEQRLELLPGGAPGADVLHTRSARTAGDSPREARLFVAEADESWREVPLERVLAPEFAQEEQAVPSTWLASGRRQVPVGERAGPHPAAPWVLGAALFLLLSTALLGRDIKLPRGTADRRPGEKEIPAGDPP